MVTIDIGQAEFECHICATFVAATSVIVMICLQLGFVHHAHHCPFCILQFDLLPVKFVSTYTLPASNPTTCRTISDFLPFLCAINHNITHAPVTSSRDGGAGLLKLKAKRTENE